MNKKLGQEPAYPTEVGYIENKLQESFQTGNEQAHYSGMSKRFYAACAVLQGFLSNGIFIQDLARKETNPDKNRKDLVRTSFDYADELLRQENE